MNRRAGPEQAGVLEPDVHARLQLLAVASGRLRIQLALSASADGPVLRETLDLIEEQLDAYQEDMRRDFKFQSSRVDNVLYEVETEHHADIEQRLVARRVCRR